MKVGDRIQNTQGKFAQVILVNGEELLVRFDEEKMVETITDKDGKVTEKTVMKRREDGSHEVLKLSDLSDWKAA